MFDFEAAILRLLALLPALTFHEFAHAYSARRCGDPTPEMNGRVTLNPLAHLDPIGTLMILIGPIGWAKPVPINPANFRHPSRDIVITSAAGPMSNLVQGVFWGLVLRVVFRLNPGVLTQGSVFGQLLVLMGFINFILLLFNLIPLGPLDGHHILEYALPRELAARYRRFNQRYGYALLFGLVLLSFMTRLKILHLIVFVPASLLMGLVTGLGS